MPARAQVLPNRLRATDDDLRQPIRPPHAIYRIQKSQNDTSPTIRFFDGPVREVDTELRFIQALRGHVNVDLHAPQPG